jgi:hypothetical protein
MLNPEFPIIKYGTQAEINVVVQELGLDPATLCIHACMQTRGHRQPDPTLPYYWMINQAQEVATNEILTPILADNVPSNVIAFPVRTEVLIELSSSVGN